MTDYLFNQLPPFINFDVPMLAWMTWRLELATSSIILFVALISVLLKDSISRTTLGLALSYAMQLTALFQRCVQLSVELSANMTSAERIFEYHAVASETNVLQDGGIVLVEEKRLEVDWPLKGQVEFRDVWMHYRSNPPVLKGVSFSVNSGERIGIVGRTGALAF